ncbi:FecR family protein [Horticoccus sp. 23ND18S-11]|uniref:FecR family protein n=1 Tax=Horticoccus sp. 23ND18S-11 TaxID=3391832 RepID=UPI0039C953F8
MTPPSSPATPPPDPAAVEDAAIGWLTERDDGFTPAREREFTQWLRADPRHAAAVARLEQTLGLLGELPDFRAELNTTFDRAAPVVPFPPPANPVPHRRPRRAYAWAGVAAALTLSAFVGWRALSRSPEIHYTTTVAGYERARLDDGSTVELNAATAVRVQFTGAERRVQLEAGEAHFAVAPDTTRPFIVNAGGVSVRAVGTAFNVRYATDGAVEVIVTEGKVRVGQAGPASSAAASAPLVAAGERLVLPKRAPPPVVEKVAPSALRAALAWQATLADFADAPLVDVIARFNARSRVQLILADPALADRRVGGTFALDEAEAFVRLLERDGEIAGERRGETEIHLRRAR